LLSPLLAVLGDTESHDRLCGQYNSRGTGVARLCPHCNTPRSQTENVDYDWEHILPEQVQSVIDAKDKEGLKALSQHPIQNAFYGDEEGSTSRLGELTTNEEEGSTQSNKDSERESTPPNIQATKPPKKLLVSSENSKQRRTMSDHARNQKGKQDTDDATASEKGESDEDKDN
jgi:hypothetical protein